MFSNYSIYKIGVFLFWICGILLVLLIPKLELHQLLNSYHTTILDSIAKYATHVGDGIFFTLIIIAFLCVSIRTSLHLLLSFLISAGVAQFLKKIIFNDAMRPMHYFQHNENFHLIENFHYHFNNSFPSGHATSCFAMFTVLSLTYSNNKLIQVACLVAAILFSYTRVYLSQHFFQDILAGSIIGAFVSQYAFQFLNRSFEKWDYSILKRRNN
jgi:membrane-associated phospholipid phosphatase